MDDQRPVVAFSVDDNYVNPLLVALTSLATAGGLSAENAAVRVLHTGLADKAQGDIVAVGNALGLDVALVPLADTDYSFPVTDWISSAAYIRLRIAEALPTAQRILYLDCDLVVCRPLHELLAQPMSQAIGAVRDTPNPQLACGKGLPGWERLGLPGEREYFNSGVLLIDRHRWVERDIGNRSAIFVQEYPEHIRLWDQDALNYVADDAWDRLDLVYNVIVLSGLMPEVSKQYAGGSHLSLEDALALEQQAVILHYAGPVKPWSPHFAPGAAADIYSRFSDELASVVRL